MIVFGRRDDAPPVPEPSGRPAVIPAELAAEILAAAWAGDVSADLGERIHAAMQPRGPLDG